MLNKYSNIGIDFFFFFPVKVVAEVCNKHRSVTSAGVKKYRRKALKIATSFDF